MLFLYYTWYNNKEISKERKSTYTLSTKQKALLQNGDIILRHGYGMVSDYIVKLFNEPIALSHCGMIEKHGDTLRVIHSTSSEEHMQDGVNLTDLDQFTKASHHHSIMVVRYKDLTPEQAEKITTYARQYAKKQIDFDYRFNTKDTSEVFCTELVWLAYKKILHKDIFIDKNRQTNLLQFKHFYTSKTFNVVVNDNK